MELAGNRIPQTTCGRAAATGTGGCSPGRRADNGSGRPEPAGRQIPQQMKPTGRKSDLRAGSRSRRPEPACNRTRQQMEPTGDRIPQTTCGRVAAADNGSGRPEPAGRQIPQQMKPTGRKSRQLQLELAGTVAAGGRIAKQSRRFFLLSCRMIVVPVFLRDFVVLSDDYRTIFFTKYMILYSYCSL